MTDLHAICAAMPGAVLTFPFGEDTAVYKVGGKMFAALPREDAASITLKAEPADVTGLVETYAAVDRGYHMSKKHWVTVQLGGDVPGELVAELVEDSHDLVVDSLPARDRP